MKYVGKNSAEFKNVYLRAASTISGPKEKKGPLGQYFDYSYSDNHCNAENWEQAEIKMQQNAIDTALVKSGLEIDNINLIIGGDLNNQLAVTNYAMRDYHVPYLGVYGACSTCVESLIIAASYIDAGFGENILTVTSSHNSTSERQFRYPTEYGGQKPNSMTSTATGAGSAIVSRSASTIKITKMTIGSVVDPELSDTQDMGRTMAPAAASTLRQHLEDFKIKPSEYDLILTGDLSMYGADVLKGIMAEFDCPLGNNYNDAGLMLYDTKSQKVFAGGSGCGCITLVGFSYVIDAMRKGIYQKVLLIATGALMNPIMVAQNETIPAIAHAIVFERSNL